jgi:hypothetical protein
VIGFSVDRVDKVSEYQGALTGPIDGGYLSDGRGAKVILR